MRDTANEIDHFTTANIERRQRRDIPPENHPQRATAGNGKRRCHARRRDLAQKDPAKERRHQRHQREHRRRRYWGRRLQTFEHQHEIQREQAAKDEIAPWFAKMGWFQVTLQGGNKSHDDGRQYKARRGDGLGVDIIGDDGAKAEGPGDKRREAKHGEMATPLVRGKTETPHHPRRSR